jgi:hypothetical protein
MVPRNLFLTVVQLVSRTFSNSRENNCCLFSVSRFADVFLQQSLCCVPFAVELGVCGCGHSAAGCRYFLPHLTSYLQDGLQYLGRCLGKQLNTYISSKKRRNVIESISGCLIVPRHRVVFTHNKDVSLGLKPGRVKCILCTPCKIRMGVANWLIIKLYRDQIYTTQYFCCLLTQNKNSTRKIMIFWWSKHTTEIY